MTVVRGIILYGDLIVASDIDFHGRRAMDAAAKGIEGFGIPTPALSSLLVEARSIAVVVLRGLIL